MAFATLVDQCLGEHSVTIEDPASSPATAIARSAEKGLEQPSPSSLRARPARRRWLLTVLTALGVGSATAVTALLVGSEPTPEPPPPIARPAEALGSALPAVAISSLDCDGETPSGSSESCTVVQTALPGHRLVARRDGVIRSWVVRGAAGELALQVVAPRGDRFFLRARSELASIPDETLHVLPANMPIRAGDLVGLEITPGAAVGVRPEIGGATTARWLGPLLISPRSPDREANTGFDHELMLRVDYVPGAEWEPPGLLIGTEAENARPGHVRGALEVDLRAAGARTVAVVRLPDRVAVDLFDDRRRVVRLGAPDMDPRGRLLGITGHGRPLALVRWRNPDGHVVRHDYTIGPDSLTPHT